MDTLAVGGVTVADTLAGDGTRVEIITGTARVLTADGAMDHAIMAVGAADGVMDHVITAVGVADGVTAIIPTGIGEELGSMLIRGGGGLTRIFIHILIPIHLISPRRRSPSSLMSIASRSNSNFTTGITARIRKVITRTSKTVQAAGCRWYQMCPHPTSRGGHGK